MECLSGKELGGAKGKRHEDWMRGRAAGLVEEERGKDNAEAQRSEEKRGFQHGGHGVRGKKRVHRRDCRGPQSKRRVGKPLTIWWTRRGG
jgi:hypothetical protein